MHRTRSVALASVVLSLGISSFAVAQSGSPQADASRTGSTLREGVRNGTTTKETEIIGNLAAGKGRTGGYVTRQSNKSTTGGGAIYGCRSTSAAGALPCVRANNLSSGKAFEFNAASAPSAGTITVGTGGDTKKPFTTNATGVADGLNADRVDGKNAADIVTDARAKANLDADTVDGLGSTQLASRWALVDETGAIIEQSGGFTVTSAYSNPNVYISAGSTLVGHGLNVSLVGQNQVDRDGVAGADPSFGGSVSVARCATTATVCAPDGTNNDNTLVVAPRVPTAPAAGGAITFENTTAASRPRFYVTVTE